MGWGTGNIGGGSGGLNFEVVGGTSEPSSPKENTIWVDTDRINNYYFSATQPENMVNYDVWFHVGTSSPVAFNALKKNEIRVYPLSAKQYVNGALVAKPAVSYIGGNWVEWFTCFYNRGDQCTDITGGWTVVKNTNAKVTFDASSISFGYSTSSNTQAITHTKNKVDVTNLKKITSLIDITTNGGYANEMCIGLFSAIGSYSATPIAYEGTTKTGTGIILELNVESYSGSYYIGLKTVGSKGKLHEVKEQR